MKPYFKNIGAPRAIAMAYLTVFGVLMLIGAVAFPQCPRGEWDDYTMPIASIINDGNLHISPDDVALYKRIYPDWAGHVEKRYRLSGYTARGGGGELTWYFPTYGVACMPMTAILRALHLRTVLAFPLTNAILLVLAVSLALSWLKIGWWRKLVIALLLTLNPIVFYVSWPSAEVFIYAMLTLGLTSWYNGWRMRAALFVSLAGMLNPTIMSIGIVMIVEHLMQLAKNKGVGTGWPEYVRGELPGLVKHWCCYVVGVIPMLYNFYHTGHINLTASLERFTRMSTETTAERAVSYLFDLNYGILPYFPILLLMSFVLAAVAIARKRWKYIVWLLLFLANVALYSVMVHINSGMSGIARYNAWSAVILIFAVAAVGLDMVEEKQAIAACLALLGTGAMLTGAIVIAFGPISANKTQYTRFTPIAEWVLDHAPWAYNPLPSSFFSRVAHLDGEDIKFPLKTPIVLRAKDGYLRKILATAEDTEEIRKDLCSSNCDVGSLLSKIQGLKGTSYVSVSGHDKITLVRDCNPGEVHCFSIDDPSGHDYVFSGLHDAEAWGAWSNGHEVMMAFKTSSTADILHADIAARVFNEVQPVTVLVNGKVVYDNPAFSGGEDIQFNFDNPGPAKPVFIKFLLPGAVSPSHLGQADTRTLAIGFIRLVILEGRRPALDDNQ